VEPPVAVKVALYGALTIPDGKDVVVIVRLGGVSVTVAVADFVVSAALVAIIDTVCREASELGAVYKPLGEMAPTKGLNVQVTAVLVVPETDARNC
jgi:hypothetical protein